MNTLIAQATSCVREMVYTSLGLTSSEQALVIYDTHTELSRVLTEAYRAVLPETTTFIDFDESTPESVIDAMRSRTEGDLVILVQSTNFRLNEFRIRIELFARGLKTIEHVHLFRMKESEYPVYLDALSYDRSFYHQVGHGLKAQLDACSRVEIQCAGTSLMYDSSMEPSKLNIGDYTGMKNVGGTFPIGEVFTEASDLSRVNGEVMLFGYANEEHYVQIVEPFKAIIQEGILTAPDAPEEFQRILDRIREDEQVIVRELGLGLNRAMGKGRIVSDITAFERQYGIHLSLGAKHTIYAKPGLKRKTGRYHVDVFVDVQKMLIDDREVYFDGQFHV